MTFESLPFTALSSKNWPVAPDKLVPGLESLLIASRCAADVAQTEWWFATEIRHLHRLGLSDTHLRWLIGRKLILHREEIPREELLGYDPCDRLFRETSQYQFSDRSCFILTEPGRKFAEHLVEAELASSRMATVAATPSTCSVPTWNLQRKELWLSGCLIKRFRVHSPNQEGILEAFQEEGWPERIFDPLQPGRLPETIKSLNRHQRTRLIRFSGDGTGQGILWEPMTPGTQLASQRA
jgi:hypothetical protein